MEFDNTVLSSKRVKLIGTFYYWEGDTLNLIDNLAIIRVINFFGENMRDLFQMHPINLSVAVWVGFIALFGIATDDGVVMATYLTQTFDRNTPENKKQIRASVVEAGEKRIRPCLMTTATTILALLPVLTSTGRGSDIMIPMAIPSFGGMLIALITLFVVPVLYSWKAEVQLKRTVK